MSSTTSKPHSLKDCPIANTHQRLRQAHVLWHQASQSYQNVDSFLTNVNSLIQELRNITFILQSEKSNFSDFDKWYHPWQEQLKKNEDSVWLKATRNLVVKQGAIAAASHFNVKFLNYEEMPVASLLTDADSDLNVLSILERKDFQSVIANIRHAMRNQGDAIIALERCWSVPELKGIDLLYVLASQYGLLAEMILDAHVHLGRLECAESEDADSEFPTHRGRTALLPCMVREHAGRTDYFTLRTLSPVSLGVKRQDTNVSEDDVEWRYQMKVGEKIQAHDSLDPVKLYEHMVWSSKRMLRKDKSLARIMMLRNGKGVWSSHMLMARERVEKYLLLHLLAQTVREEGCDALVEVSETWVADATVTIPELEALSFRPNRDKRIGEAIVVRVETRDGLRKESRTLFTRGSLGGIKLSDTYEDDGKMHPYLAPIYRVWREQNAYAMSEGSRLPVWKPEYAEPCLCGSNRSFGTCCFPILAGVEDITFAEFEELIEKGKDDEAERQARAAITRYACWIRQHIPMFYDKSAGRYSDEMVAIDCAALESHFRLLERWGTQTDNIDAVTDCYRSVEEAVGVPAIARRLVALGARWMLENGRLEHGLLEVGRLGDFSRITDTRALLLLAQYAEYEPLEKRDVLEKAAHNALDDDERQMCQLALAMEHGLQGERKEALEMIDTLIASSENHRVKRGALTLKWEITQSEDDFAQMFELMKCERIEEMRFAAAAFLQSKRKYDAVLDLLAPMLEENHPVAQLIAAECDMHLGNCENAGARITAIEADDNDEDIRGGIAFSRARLVLDCGIVHLKENALERLTALSDADVNFDRQGLIDALRRIESPR